MHARVTTTHVKPGPGVQEEANMLYRQEVLPEAAKLPGYAGSMLLIDPKGGKGITIVLYETEAHLKAAFEGGHPERLAGKVAHLTAAPPYREEFEVAVKDGELGDQMTHARVTFATIATRHADEAVRIFRDDIMPVNRTLTGYKGCILLVDRSNGNGIVFGLYDSEAHMRAAEENGHYHREISKLTALFARPPMRETFSVESAHAAAAAAAV